MRSIVLEITIGSAINYLYFKYFLSRLKNNEDNLIQEDLAKLFRRNESTITRTLRKLDENNRRKNLVYLTNNGIELVNQMKEADEKWEKSALN